MVLKVPIFLKKTPEGDTLGNTSDYSINEQEFEDFDDEEDFGDASYLAAPDKKPDGTDILPVDVPTKIVKGIANKITGLKQEAAANKIENGKSKVQKEEAGKTSSNLSSEVEENLIPNPLEDFASFNTLWSLACLTPQQYNKPDSYRSNDLSGLADFDMNETTGSIVESSIVFSSAGRGDQYRTNTIHGSPEYFVDDFEMTNMIAANPKAGNTNATKFSFKIIEPYSMGLLLQSLQNAAIKAGYTTYAGAPFVLKLDIVGFNQDGTSRKTVKSKYFTINITKVTFEVTEAGSEYQCTAVPVNQGGYSDTTNTLFKDISLTLGDEGTVEELLVSGDKSLCTFLNDNEKKLVKEGRIGVADVYEIQFPVQSSDFIRTEKRKEEKSATNNLNAATTKTVVSGSSLGSDSSSQATGDFGKNPIGQSIFGFDQSSGGIVPFKLEGDVIEEGTGKVTRDKMVIDGTKRTFQFTQSMSLTDIITQVINSSSYSKNKFVKPDLKSDGLITWYKIDVQIEFLEFDDLVGDYARKIIYRIVPYKVHHTIFSNPNSAPVGYRQMAKRIVKKYNYIYTGQNADVLKFDIQINNLFFAGMNPSAEASTVTVVNPDQNGVGATTGNNTPTGKGKSAQSQAESFGRSRIRRDPTLLKNKFKGGSGERTTEQLVAESFHNAFINGSSADLVRLNLEVLGDPYWLVDSGMGNYFSPPSDGSDQINQDGAAHYEGNDLYIYISFRTPADFDEKTGTYQFSKYETESPFSGIYRVTKCVNNFNGNVWTQNLTCIRMQGQDSKNQPIDTDNALQTKIGEKKPIPTSVTEDQLFEVALEYDTNPDSEQTRMLAEQEAEFFEDDEEVQEVPPSPTSIPSGTESNETDGSVSGNNLDIDGA